MTKSYWRYAPIAILTLTFLSACALKPVCPVVNPPVPKELQAPPPPPLMFSQCLQQILSATSQTQIGADCLKILQQQQTQTAPN